MFDVFSRGAIKRTAPMSAIVSPRPVTIPVRLPDYDLVRKGELRDRCARGHVLTTSENFELLEIDRRLNAKLDEKIRLEREEFKGRPHEL